MLLCSAIVRNHDLILVLHGINDLHACEIPYLLYMWEAQIFFIFILCVEQIKIYSDIWIQ